MAGDWQLSSKDAYIEPRGGHTILKALCRNERGQWVHSELDLDDHIGDEHSTVPLPIKRGFTKNAHDIRFGFEGAGDDQPVLRATVYGNSQANINTREHIRNINGHLEFDLPPL
ncbi:hypothetical protein KXV89_000126 [Aspergillus fumigatus]|nr:hypothetical protein KXV89_000126 [Aspergillus fumigatus]